MKSAAQILSVLAILGALAAGGLWYMIKGQKEELIQQRDTLTAQLNTANGQITTLNGKVGELETANTALNTELAETKTRNTQLEARFNQLNRDLNATRSELTTAQEAGRRLQAEVTQLRRELVDARASSDAGQLAAAQARIADLERQLNAANAAGLRLAPGERVPLLNTNVAFVGPEAAYIVVGIGSTAGVKRDMMIAVERNGEIIAQARVVELREDAAVADVIPNTVTSVPAVGDAAYTVL